MPHILYHTKWSDSVSPKCSRVVILTIILSSEYLRGDVIGGTTESACCIARSQTLLQKQKDHKLCELIWVGCKPTLLQVLLSKVHNDITRAWKPHLAHAVVCKFDVSLWVQQHVVQFQISVDDSPFVEVVERKTDLCRVESVKEN